MLVMRFFWAFVLVVVSSAERIYRYPNNTAQQQEEENNPHRIVGGRPISIRETPWQVAVIDRRQFVCGGSVISNYWVLTAAHCCYGYRGPYTVRAASRRFKRGGQLRSVSRIIIHKHYNERTMQHDIAMMRVRRPFHFNSHLRPVHLASTRSSLPKKFFISGWGAIGEQRMKVRSGLRGVMVKLVSRSTCVRKYKRGNVKLPQKAFCSAARHKDSCSGDSGGALVHRQIQFGIVSFGIGCARSRFPGVYTDVRRYRRWIHRIRASY